MKRVSLYIAIALLVIGIATYKVVNLPSPKKQPNVVFLLLDTLRADHLGVYGYERNTTPVLDQFARENVLFQYAVTAAPWTPPSVASMFTGLYPTQHGMMPPNSRELAESQFRKLDSSHITLAELFKNNGYYTAAVSPNPWITKEFGFNKGFERFLYRPRASADHINGEAFRLLKEWKDQENRSPIFLYLHYLDPHDPYEPPAPFNKEFSGSLKRSPFGEYSEETMREMNLYDGEIRYLDSRLGRLFKRLKALGIYDDTIIVVVGDHGEQFMEHGNQGHGYQLHNEEINVPMILKTNQPPREVDFTVSTIDLFPTLLELAGINFDYKGLGVSLVSDENSRDRAGVFSEIERHYEQRSFTSFEGQRIVIDYKLGEVDSSGDPIEVGVGVFDRHRDYTEKRSIDDPQLREALYRQLKEIIANIKGGALVDVDKVELNHETVQQLKSLGYLK